MKTVCDVLGVALFFGSEKKTITRRAGLSPHQAYRRLGVGHPIQDQPQSNRCRFALGYRHYVS